MAFEIQDLMVDVIPGTGRAPLWATCPTATMIKSECADPSCGGQCKPHSHCGPVTRPEPQPEPRPDEPIAAPAGLLLLRQQLRQTLAPR
jgi:hypothetical protein